MAANPVSSENAQGKLTTHVLDTANGKPGAGMALSLFRVEGATRKELVVTSTNSDGRCDAPLLEGLQFIPGTYELEFGVGDYFGKTGEASTSAGPRFLDTVLIRFGISSPEEHYHVPLLVSPFAYSTYRGS